MKKFLKIFSSVALIVAILAVILFGVAQTALFKNWLRAMLIAFVSNNLNAELQLGEFHGNLFTGMRIDGISMSIEKNIFLTADAIEFRYNPIKLVQKQISLNNVHLDHPKVHLIRYPDGSWNYKHLGSRSKITDTTSTFDWTIDVKNLEVRSGEISSFDPLIDDALPRSTKSDDEKEIPRHIQNINLKVSANFSRFEQNLNINNLSFLLPALGVQLQRLSGKIHSSPNVLEVQNIEIATARSLIHIKGKLSGGLDLFGKGNAKSLEQRPTQLEVTATQVDFDEFGKVLPQLAFISGRYFLQAKLVGEVGNLRVEQFSIDTKALTLKVTGCVQNLLHPETTVMNLSSSGTVRDPSALSQYLPTFGIPRFTQLGEVKFDVQLEGKLNEFSIHSKLFSENAGITTAQLHFNSTGDVLAYDAKFSGAEIDLAKILEEENLASKLNFEGELKGKGTDIHHLNSTLDVAFTSSQVHQVVLNHAHLLMEVKNKVITAHLNINAAEATASTHTRLSFLDKETPSYEFEAKVSSLNLAQLLRDSSYQSDLHFTLAAFANGTTLDDLSGTLTLAFDSSKFRDRRFEGTGLTLELHQPDHENRKLVLTSNFVNATMSGDFHLRSLLALTAFEVENFTSTIREKFQTFDSTRGSPDQFRMKRTPFRRWWDAVHKPSLQEKLSFTYDIHAKHLIPIALFFGLENFTAKGSVHGYINGNAEQLQLGGTINLDNLVYAAGSDKFFATRGIANFQFDHITSQDLLNQLQGNFDAEAANFFFKGLQFSRLHIGFEYHNAEGNFEAASLIDSVFTVQTYGSLQTLPQQYVIKLQNVLVGYNRYYLTNDQPMSIIFDAKGITVKDMMMAHEKSKLSLDGILHNDGILDAKMALQNFSLEGLKTLFPHEETLSGQRTFLGVGNLDASFFGPWRNPDISLHAVATDVKYGEMDFGTFDSKIEYHQQQADVDLSFNSKTSQEAKLPDLWISGSLPFNLAFANHQEWFPDGNINLRIQSNGFHLDLLDPFVVVFSNIQGRVLCDVQVTGTVKQPNYAGTISLEDGRFLFLPNNIFYNASGKFEPKENKILISNLIISNDPKDQSNGVVTVNGELTLKGIGIEIFDLSAQGQLLILKGTSRKALQIVYGDLFAATGPGGLRYQGSFKQSYLSGSIIIQHSSLLFPPVRQSSAYNPSNSSVFTGVSYVIIDDTTKTKPLSEEDSLSISILSAKEKGGGNSNSKNHLIFSILDGLSYDLTIESKGGVELKMVFTPTTGEELFANLTGKLFLTKEGSQNRFLGNVTVGNHSYYHFYKRFDASGDLRFAGDFENPELDITATYEGFHPKSLSDSLRSKEERVIITLKITGTRKEPKLNIDMTVDGKEWTGDAQSDAVSFIISGKFRDDLTAADRSQIAASLGSSMTSTVLSGVTSSLLSGMLTDFLRREVGGFIRSAELSYSGGSVSESADLRLTGEVGSAVIRFGGKVFNDIGNANVSVQMPMGEIFGLKSLQDLILELERRVEGSNYSTEEKKLTNGARIYYRISF